MDGNYELEKNELVLYPSGATIATKITVTKRMAGYDAIVTENGKDIEISHLEDIIGIGFYPKEAIIEFLKEGYDGTPEDVKAKWLAF